jgi:hypothetical protein
VTRSPTYSPHYAPHSAIPAAGLFSIRPWRGWNETFCGLSTIRRKAAAAIKKKLPTRNGGEITHSGSGVSVRGARRIPRSGVVSRLRQAAKIALAHSCAPGIAIISAKMIPPSSGD